MQIHDTYYSGVDICRFRSFGEDPLDSKHLIFGTERILDQELGNRVTDAHIVVYCSSVTGTIIYRNVHHLDPGPGR